MDLRPTRPTSTSSRPSSSTSRPRPKGDRSPQSPKNSVRAPQKASAVGPEGSRAGSRAEEEPEEVKRTTVVDIDRVREEEEEALGLLEVMAPDDGVKRRSLGLLEWLLMVLVLSLVLLLLPFSVWFCVRVVREHERAVVFRLGHLLRAKPRGPGLLLFLPVLDVCVIVDVRLKTLLVPLHTVVTKDLSQWELSALCHYRLENVALYSGALCSLEPAVQAVLRAAIRDILSRHTVQEAVGARGRLGEGIRTSADAVLSRWGIRLERADIEEMVLPTELQRRLQTEPEEQVDVDPWDGLRSSLRLLRPALVLPLPPDLLNVTSDPAPLPPPPPTETPPPPPVAAETERKRGTRDSPMM